MWALVGLELLIWFENQCSKDPRPTMEIKYYLHHSSQLSRITTGDPINIKRTADGHTHFMLWLNERIYFERKTASFANYWRQYKIIRNVCN